MKQELFTIRSGSTMIRIREEPENEQAPVYRLYETLLHELDLAGQLPAQDDQFKYIKTNSTVETLQQGDLVFSLMTGKAAIAGPAGDGCLISQNFLILEPSASLDKSYLAFRLNEDPALQKQLRIESSMPAGKIPIRMVEGLEFGELPALEQQEKIGRAYLKAVQLQWLEQKNSSDRLKLTIGLLQSADQGKKAVL